MEIKELSMDLGGRKFTIKNGPFATYATGYAIVSLGETIIMANALFADKGKEDADFFPLTVDYEENMYAAGKIKGSRFIKREGRPSEKSILTSRLIDRPIRPLFPKHTTNEVQLICTALSADLEVDPATTAMNAASAALLVSGAPFEGPIGAVRIGYLNDKLILNPTYQECDEGKLNLVVAGTMDAITMVEAAAKEVTEDIMLQALELAHKHIKEICEFQLNYAKMFEVKRLEPTISKTNEEAVSAVTAFITDEMLNSVTGMTKMEVKAKVHAIEDQLIEKYSKEIEEEKYSEKDLKTALNEILEKNMRKNILEKEIRIDGRKLTEIRPITVIADILPKTHGSAIFQRGETTALTITTLGGPTDAQIIDNMDKDETKRYFHHYHFPSYATGEIKPIRGPSRREIGHGDLAERALIPVLPTEEEFPYTIWLVSEITRCNGSSSMASVCGSSLSLMAAGVPIKKPVSGIAMGLVSDKETKKYKILSDIQGLEDFAGDMDFKVTGTVDGITALQMDIKVKGLTLSLLREALAQANEGRKFILAKMAEVLPEPRKELSPNAPLIMKLKINPDYIKVVIGKGGEMINKIIAECTVDIDIKDDGLVIITAQDQEKGNKAIEWIKRLTWEPTVGEIMDGKIVKIMDFGAFVEVAPGKEGLVHISQFSKKRLNKVEEVAKMGDVIKVKLINIDDQGRYNFSHKDAVDNESISQIPKSDPTSIPNSIDKKDEGRGVSGTRVPGTSSVRKVNG